MSSRSEKRHNGIIQALITSLGDVACAAVIAFVLINSDKKIKKRVQDQLSILLDSSEKALLWFSQLIKSKVQAGTVEANKEATAEELVNKWSEIEDRLRLD